MLHPSYSDLMNVVNSEIKEDEKPIVNSRYSIVIATAKRARQLIEDADSSVDNYKMMKPLSVAVEEIMSGKVKILSGGADTEEDEDKILMSNDVYDIAIEDDDEDIYAEESDKDDDSEADSDSDKDSNGDSEEDDYE